MSHILFPLQAPKGDFPPPPAPVQEGSGHIPISRKILTRKRLANKMQENTASLDSRKVSMEAEKLQGGPMLDLH